MPSNWDKRSIGLEKRRWQGLMETSSDRIPGVQEQPGVYFEGERQPWWTGLLRRPGVRLTWPDWGGTEGAPFATPRRSTRDHGLRPDPGRIPSGSSRGARGAVLPLREARELRTPCLMYAGRAVFPSRDISPEGCGGSAAASSHWVSRPGKNKARTDGRYVATLRAATCIRPKPMCYADGYRRARKRGFHYLSRDHALEQHCVLAAP